MTWRSGGKTEAAFQTADLEYGASRAQIVFWDTSKNPKTNDRDKKLGSGDQTHGISWWDFDKKTVRVKAADGLENPKGLVAYRLLEPDNHVLRLHKKKGQGIDGVWALRLTVDDQHKDWERECRSTMVIDQCDKQSWDWSHTQWKIRRLGVSNSHDELKFLDSGFLANIDGKGGGKLERACLMLNLNKRGGHTTDGKLAGQLWHVLHLSPVNVKKFSPPTSPGETIAEPSLGSGSTTTDGGCGSVTKYQGTLRGDVRFHFKKGIASLAMGDASPTDGEIITGFHWLHVPVESPPPYELDTDENSNQAILNRNPERGIWVFVKNPRFPGVPTENIRDVPTGFPGRPATVDTPTIVEEGVFEAEAYEATGNDVGQAGVVTIPEDINDGWHLTCDVNWVTPAAGLVGNVGIRFDYAVIAKGASARPAGLTGSLTKTLAAATYTGSGTLQRALFEIPTDDISSAAGGKVAWALYREGTDGQTDSWNVVGVKTFFGKTEIQEA